MSRVSIVEDQSILADQLELLCRKNNHEVIGKYENGEAFIDGFEKSEPEVVLMDLHLGEGLNGVETIESLKARSVTHFGVVYMTSHKEPTLLRQAMKSIPNAFIIKPICEQQLNMMINTTSAVNTKCTEAVDHTLIDRIFVRDQHRFVAIKLEDVCYFKADRCYTEIHTNTKKYISSESLNHFEELVQVKNFLRIHRSWMINMSLIDAVEENRLEINGNMLPMGKTYKKRVKSFLKII